jgi:hypothetical protein
MGAFFGAKAPKNRALRSNFLPPPGGKKISTSIPCAEGNHFKFEIAGRT